MFVFYHICLATYCILLQVCIFLESYMFILLPACFPFGPLLLVNVGPLPVFSHCTAFYVSVHLYFHAWSDLTHAGHLIKHRNMWKTMCMTQNCSPVFQNVFGLPQAVSSGPCFHLPASSAELPADPPSGLSAHAIPDRQSQSAITHGWIKLMFSHLVWLHTPKNHLHTLKIL